MVWDTFTCPSGKVGEYSTHHSAMVLVAVWLVTKLPVSSVQMIVSVCSLNE